MTSTGPTPLLRFSKRDNVGVATRDLAAGERAAFDGGEVVVLQDVGLGHKVALAPIGSGDKVVKYGASIGTCTQAVDPGGHVHLHNLRSDYMPPAGRPEVMG